MHASPLILIQWRIFLRWEEITDVNLGLGLVLILQAKLGTKMIDWENIEFLKNKYMYYFPLQDHEFIPTRQKTITASRPAADPGKFTKVPSNPLLISAQRQIMQAEEIRRRKESRERAEKAAAAAGLTNNTFCPV